MRKRKLAATWAGTVKYGCQPGIVCTASCNKDRSMLNVRRTRATPRSGWQALLFAGAIFASVGAFIASATPAAAENAGADELLSAVVQLKTYINPEGRTVKGLGQQRAGSGIVIDDNGLILTIGYLMVEAHSAEVLTNGGRKSAAEIV